MCVLENRNIKIRSSKFTINNLNNSNNESEDNVHNGVNDENV